MKQDWTVLGMFFCLCLGFLFGTSYKKPVEGELILIFGTDSQSAPSPDAAVQYAKKDLERSIGEVVDSTVACFPIDENRFWITGRVQSGRLNWREVPFNFIAKWDESKGSWTEEKCIFRNVWNMASWYTPYFNPSVEFFEDLTSYASADVSDSVSLQ